MSSSSLSRTLRTVRHLRFSQLYWRVRYRLRRRSAPVIPEPPQELELADDPPCPAPLHLPWRNSDADFVHDLERGQLDLVGHKGQIGDSPDGWHLGPCQQHRLWTITIHYHEWLYRLAKLRSEPRHDPALISELLESQLSSWLTHCPLEAPGARDLAWNSYAIATRISWWCRSHALLADEFFAARPELHSKFVRSLWQQSAFLAANLEFDLRANHLLRDVVGLAWAGRFFAGPHAHRWLQTAAKMAVQQAREQVLPDGGHFERSAYYHLHALGDLLELHGLLPDETTRQRLSDVIVSMTRFSMQTRHPGDSIPLFGDASLADAASSQDLLEALSRAAIPHDVLESRVTDNARQPGLLSYPDFGLERLSQAPWTLFFKTSGPGPSYQPGHSHADALSIEVSHGPQRVIVDPGSHSYDHDARRAYDRSSLAHNSVVIDGQDSSEVWHIFRVGRRCRARVFERSSDPQSIQVHAAHDGYRHLPGRPRHLRRVQLSEAALHIHDQIESSSPHELRGGLLIAPEWNVSASTSGWTLEQDNLRLELRLQAPDDAELSQCERPYHPSYGTEVPATRVEWCCPAASNCAVHWTLRELDG
jgi:uncharacterized heparinase superfamily protein